MCLCWQKCSWLQYSHSEAGIPLRARISLQKDNAKYHTANATTLWICLFVFLCTHITPTFSSWASWSRFTLGPWLALLEGNKSHSFPLSERETSNFIRGATYWLSWSSFKSRFTLLTTVTSGATRSTLTLVSSVTLRIIGENFITWPCQAETISSVNALILSYRFSSWSRIAKASSSLVSLSSNKTKSQNKELQLWRQLPQKQTWRV